jgi:hypothetical protein
MDITSLYTNIDINLLDQTILDLESIPQAKRKILSILLSFILKNNYFEYNDSIYYQTNGIAMGTNSAVNLANLFLSELLDTAILKSSFSSNIILYKRYIDDIFGIWRGSEKDFNEFFNFVNQIIPGIKLTKLFANEVSYLDILISLKDSKISFKPYSKELASFQYIPPFSSHPPACFKGYFKAETLRLATNSSNVFDFIYAKNLFRNNLYSRGFAKKFIDSELSKIHYSNRIPIIKNSTLDIEPQSNVKTFTIIIPYTHRQGISKLTRLIHDSSKPNEEFKVILAYKKCNNIKSLVTRSKLTKNQSNYLKSD